ncbi:hypothetical protein RFI_12063 [Reticulomyxa filosa]|uniref:Uncharacterized protein n=1 Tax=Reticulomyxa filosa TaxID=46433 RepID=X6NGP1_RETFI|nr:hypothetical protein RFI_12063 [Reticulomyxa filosa]|eukprot:ETO25078.1 hypothetical protein RFI_12063 [Reticulomyxa filosa]
MENFPAFPNLIHLELTNVFFDDKMEWINPSKMPNLRCLVINHLSFAQSLMSLRLFIDYVEKEGVSCDDIKDEEKNFNEPSSLLNGPNYEIELVNSILKLCPNLIAFCYQHNGKSQCVDSKALDMLVPIINTHNEDVLQVPPNLEWLWIGHMPRTILDLSLCKNINGIALCDIPALMILGPTEHKLKIGCLQIETNKGRHDFTKTNVITTWKDFLSIPSCLNVQLAYVKRYNTIYDLSESGSIIPADQAKIYAFHEKIRGRMGVDLTIAAEIWLYMRNNPTAYFIDHVLTGLDESSLELKESLFYKIVEIMNIDNNKVREYENWFKMGIAKWIHFF